LAALAGYAPDDEMRAADLFAIQGAYASTTEALASRVRSALQMGLVGAVFLVSRTVTTA
jgi:hypothetical protein